MMRQQLFSSTALIVVGRGASYAAYLLFFYFAGFDSEFAPLAFAWSVTLAMSMLVTSTVEYTFVSLASRSGQTPATGELRSLFTALLCVFSILALLALAILYPVCRAMPAFGPQRASEVAILFALFTPHLFLHLFSSAYRGLGQARGDYVGSAVSISLEGVVALLCALLLAPVLGPVAAPISHGAGSLAACAWLRLRAGEGGRLLAAPGYTGGGIRLVGTQAVATSLYAVVPVLDQTIAGTGDSRAVTITAIAMRLFVVPIGLALSGYLPVFLHHCSVLYAANESCALWRYCMRALRRWTLLGLAISAIAAFIHHGSAWQKFAIHLQVTPLLEETATVLLVLLVGTGPYIGSLLLGRALIATKSNAGLLRAASFYVASGLLMKLLLFPSFGAVGIAAGSTAAALLTVLVQIIALHGRLRPSGTWRAQNVEVQP